MSLRFNSILVLIIALICIFLQNSLYAKDDFLQKFKSKLPQMLGANNIGNDYWLSFNVCYDATGVQGNSLYIYVSSEFETTVTLEVPGKGYLRQQKTVPNEVMVFVLSPGIGQCYRKTDRVPPDSDAVYSGYGVHVFSDEPIIVIGVTRMAYCSDSYLALPVASLGKNYVISSWPDIGDNRIQWLPGETNIVSPYDNNTVKFTMWGTAGSKTRGGQLPGETRTYTLNKGDVLAIASDGQRADISGSRVIATKPVAVISGSYGAYVPELTPYWDFLTEMEIPSYAWGKAYHFTPFAGRLKNMIARIYAKEEETNIYRDGIIIATLKDSSGMRDDGWINMRADVGAPRPIVFSADKPFYVVEYNTGNNDDGRVVNTDPFMMVLTSVEQYQRELIFNNPGIKGGLGFATNWINIVYESEPDGKIPNDLEIAQVENGVFVWKKMLEVDSASGVPFSYPINGKIYSNKMLKLTTDGVYKLKAKNPITAYAYGASQDDSYGHPTSVLTLDLSKDDSLPPNPTWSVKCDGTIDDGYVYDLPTYDNNNRSNLSMIYLNTNESYNYNFTYDEFIPREQANTHWQANVIDKNKDAKAVIHFVDGSGNDSTISLYYFVRKISVLSDSVNFGNFGIGEDSTIFNYIINKLNGQVIIDSAFFKNNNKGFELTGLILPDTLNREESLKFGIKFTATEEGQFVDSIGFSGHCLQGEIYKLAVYANVGEPRIEVTNLDFDTIKVGDIKTKELEVRNLGTSDLIITGVIGPSNKSVFIDRIGNISDSIPLIIEPYKYKTFEVDFYPQEGKEYIDTIYFISNADKSAAPDSIAELRGYGLMDLGPVIDVSDANFGYVIRYTKIARNIIVKNIGDKVLNIKGYSRPNYILFEEQIPEEISETNPLILNPEESWTFEVNFNAQEVTSIGFIDTIAFSSNANSGDNIAVLTVDSVVYTGIDELNDGTDVSIIPNPCDDFISFRKELNAADVTIKIFDVWGLNIYEEKINSSLKNHYIKTTNFPIGTYFLQLYNNKETIVRKFSVLR